CETCLAELGDRDAFIATGPGDFASNALQFDWNYQQCLELCTPHGGCKAGYDMILMDVAKGQQYGRYIQVLNPSNVVNPSVHKLSVFNEQNLLPKNELMTANWRHPLILLNGFEYPFYLDGDGRRSKIKVIPTASGYYPAVEDEMYVFTIDGEYY